MVETLLMAREYWKTEYLSFIETTEGSAKALATTCAILLYLAVAGVPPIYVQTAREYSEEKLNQVRRVFNDGIGATADVVYTGYVVKPDRLSDGRRDVRIFIEGEKLYTGPDPDDNGNRVRVRIGDIAYEGNWNSDDIRVGPPTPSGRARCFKLQKYEVQDARYEQWAITFQTSVLTGERYFITREKLEAGQDGHWEIVKTEINRTKLERPKVRPKLTVDVQSRRQSEPSIYR